MIRGAHEEFNELRCLKVLSIRSIGMSVDPRECDGHFVVCHSVMNMLCFLD